MVNNRRIECQIKCPKKDKMIYQKHCFWCKHYVDIKKVRIGYEVICDYEGDN